MKRQKRQAQKGPGGGGLAATERQMSAVLRDAQVIAVLLDTEGRLVYANDYLLKLTGYKRREIIGRDWFSRFVPDYRPDVKAEFIHGLRRGVIAPRFENPIRAKNGESHLIAWNNQTLRGPDGVAIGAASIGVDISLLKISRRAQIITAANRLVSRSQDEKKLLAGLCRLLVKQGGYRMAWVGYARDDRAKSVQLMAQAGFVKGYLKNRRISWGNNPRGRAPAGRAIRTGKAVVIQRIVTDPAFPPWRQEALRHGYASCAALPLHDHGEIRGVLMLYATDPDAFDSNEMELLGQLADDLIFGIKALRDYHELAEAQERLRLTLESIGDGFVALDRDWRYVYVNAAAERLLDMVRGEVLGRTIWEVWPHTVGGDIERQMRRAAAGEAVEFEDYFAQQNRWFFDRFFPRKGGGIVIYFRDITRHKVAEAALAESQAALRALLARVEAAREEERTRIARDIHDDFGQTLTAIKMDLHQIEHAVRKTEFTGPREEVLERTAGAIELVDSAQTTVQEIAAKLRPGILDRLGLGPALQYQARRFQQHSGIPCATAVGDPLPELPPRIVTALFRIFQECLTNVARHAGASQVAAQLEAADGAVCLRVRDDGIGIPPEALIRSTSLGLLGIRERVAALNGVVVFRPGEQGGTVVEVNLPLDARSRKGKKKLE